MKTKAAPVGAPLVGARQNPIQRAGTSPAPTIKESLVEIFRRHTEAVEKSFTSSQVAVLEKIAELMAETLRSRHKIMLCGNGGSAADSQHIAAEFIGRFNQDRRSLPALALTTDTSILTAVGNDYSYEQIFSRQVEGLGQDGDLLIGISTSGNSKNVLEAVKAAKAIGINTVGFTGAKGGALKNLADLCFQAASGHTPHIQEVHITALHALSDVTESLVFSKE